MTRHRLRDLAKKFRGKENVLQHLRESISIVLQVMKDRTESIDLEELISVVLKEWDNEVCSEEVNDCINEVLSVIDRCFHQKSDSYIMPEALRTNLQTSMNKCLSNKQFVEDLHRKLTTIVPCTMSAFSLFLFDFLWELINRSSLFVCKSMMDTLPTSKVDTIKSDAHHFITHQVVYHVAGFALFHHVSHAKKYPKNEKLVRIKNCILTKFVQEGSIPTLTTQDKAYWTSALNRKSLYFVNDKAFHFFLKLANVLQASEEKDGSIVHVKVQEKVVTNSHLLALWDAIVGNVLDERESFDLMIKTVKVVSSTFGRGNLRKKMNMMSKNTEDTKNVLSISHRAKLL